MKLKTRIQALVVAVSLAITVMPLNSFAAKKITTPSKSISRQTDTDVFKVTVNSADGAKTYNIFAQGGSNIPVNSYIDLHGCAVSALTTVLSAHTKKYSSLTPTKTYKTLEKKVFGTKVWKANYRKSVRKQMPVSLYGISRILKYSGIKNRYVRYFKDQKAVSEIKAHLYKGKPVIIEVNNHTQKNGKISSKYNNKWANSKHTMVLLGMTDNNKVIIADSAYRKWSGTKQRVKFAKMESLVHYMIPCKSTSYSCYYKSSDSCGGYILVR